MYFLERGKMTALGPLGPTSSQQADCVLCLCSGQQGGRHRYLGQGDWVGTQKTAAEDTHTQRWGLTGKGVDP